VDTRISCNHCAWMSHGRCYQYDCPEFQGKFPSEHRIHEEEEDRKYNNWLGKNVKYISRMLGSRK